MDIVVMCKDCKFETTVMSWGRGKNKYLCFCNGLKKEE